MTQRTSANSRKKVKIETDIVSTLPDDMILEIISRLTVREAFRTSVLSRRWKSLWRFLFNLDFEPSKSAMAYPLPVDEQIQRRSSYITWVNRVLRLHRGRVNEFRIRFDLFDLHEKDITRWIYAAMARGVQKFELNLQRCWWYRKESCKLYTFPRQCCNNLKNVAVFSNGLKSLRSLSFNQVNVTGEILEFFIHNCPLERLHVACSENLHILRVVGSSIQLKYLDISWCTIRAVDISAPSLLSFKCIGSKIQFNIENVPRLVDFSVGWSSFSRLDLRRVTGLLARHFAHLTHLDLGHRNYEIYEEFSHCYLPNLRHLTLAVILCYAKGPLFLTYVIKACPFLQKLTLKLSYNTNEAEREIHQIPVYSLPHLKVLELFEYDGISLDLELVSYLLKGATMLQKVIVKGRTFFGKVIAEKCPKDLGPMLPQGVQLIVLKSYRDKYFIH